jgi:acetylornithine deacetylase
MNDYLSRERVGKLLQELVRIPSENPILVPGRPDGEAAVAKYALGWLRAARVDAWLEEAAPGRPNVVGRVGSGAGPTLVLCGHTDTVAGAGMSIPPFEPTVDGSRVYGRGAYDMKCGVAAAMAAVAALRDAPLAGSVLLALVVDEEYASAGAEHFVANHAADACILTEPTEGRLIVAHKGFVWAELTTTGRAAHGSLWDEGISAIGRMAAVIAELELHDREDLRRRTHPLVGPASLHCSLIEGGSGISTYAAECRLKVERRTLPGEEAPQVLRELADVAARPGERVELKGILDRPAMACDPDADVVRVLRDVLTETSTGAPVETGVAYWTDAALFAAAGIPAINYGPSGTGAHAAVEWVDLDSVVECAKVLAESARRFCVEARS